MNHRTIHPSSIHVYCCLGSHGSAGAYLSFLDGFSLNSLNYRKFHQNTDNTCRKVSKSAWNLNSNTVNSKCSTMSITGAHGFNAKYKKTIPGGVWKHKIVKETLASEIVGDIRKKCLPRWLNMLFLALVTVVRDFHCGRHHLRRTPLLTQQDMILWASETWGWIVEVCSLVWRD